MMQTSVEMHRARRWLWLGFLTAASVLFSLGLACATPFAALGAIAALNMGRRDAVILILAAWLANQAVGYGILAYPQTFESVAWGAAMGAAALIGTLVAHRIAGQLAPMGRAFTTVSAFGAAFLTFEAALFAASFLLPGSGEPFSLAVVGQILLTNTVALAGLLVLYRLGTAIGLVAGHAPRVTAAVSAA
ncbi:hypothetical protein [Rhodospirillaceae bacterium SYSU D60014]|uniref:hypothetical protein n=1 Tax=Virgifigura deserti TaxID=2268457 RepID=UPI000E664060